MSIWFRYHCASLDYTRDQHLIPRYKTTSNLTMNLHCSECPNTVTLAVLRIPSSLPKPGPTTRLCSLGSHFSISRNRDITLCLISVFQIWKNTRPKLMRLRDTMLRWRILHNMANMFNSNFRLECPFKNEVKPEQGVSHWIYREAPLQLIICNSSTTRSS